jgi:putative ABC transport system permease protein
MKNIIRNLIRNPLNSTIIIVSLAVGMASINLIAVFLSREANADKFQNNYSRMYALQADDPFNKGQKIYYICNGAPEYIKENFSEVDDYCKISNASPKKVEAGEHEYFDDKKTIAVSSNFFNFFSYELLSGSPNNVLETKNDLVISENLALKYFGNSDPLNQKVTFTNGIEEVEMIIRGVFRKPVHRTQLDFEMVKLIGDIDSRCYLLLKENTDTKKLEEKFALNREKIPTIHDGTPGLCYLNSMKESYFDTSRAQTIEFSRNKKDLIIALIVALMILSVAIFNYLGLINNRLSEKTREYAIRKVSGGSKMNLVNSFMGELLLQTGLSFLFSLLLMIWAIPFFNQLTDAGITVRYIFSSNIVIVLFAVPLFIILVSLVFSITRISRYIKPELLKPGKSPDEIKFNIPAFNVMQLIISIFLLIGSVCIMKQMHYITNKEIGLNKEVLEVKIPDQYKDKSKVIKSELGKNPSVELISLANSSPVLEHIVLLLHYDEGGTDKKYTPGVFPGDENFSKVLGIQIVKGEDFSGNGQSNQGKCIINESMASLFPGQDLIGKIVPGNPENIIVGICEDFHYSSLKKVIEPAYIAYSDKGYYLLVKPNPGQMLQAENAITEIWDEMIPDYPVNIESIGDRFEWYHRDNEDFVKLIGSCCLISVFLSMIGLFAVSYFNSRRRIKEIGIRKVSGASIRGIMIMLNKDFTRWVLIAFVIAIPSGWYIMHKWLEGFAYRTTLSWWIFALSGLLVLGIALLTVSWQSWKAATRNPVETLRYE